MAIEKELEYVLWGIHMRLQAPLLRWGWAGLGKEGHRVLSSQNSKLDPAFNIIMKVHLSRWKDRTYFI